LAQVLVQKGPTQIIEALNSTQETIHQNMLKMSTYQTVTLKQA